MFQGSPVHCIWYIIDIEIIIIYNDNQFIIMIMSILNDDSDGDNDDHDD